MDKYMGKRLDGRYEIKEIIGVGGMAYVYKAYDNIDDRVVAVKILKEEYLANDEFTRRFKNESKAIAILSHPNIVKVYDVSFGDKLQYIVMEYIDGITLKEYIDQQEEFKWKEAVHFTVQILRALQHAHDKGIVHRDIKPQNIMLLPDGTIKVTDFGIARFSRQDIRTTRSTDKAIGSVHYISPEQARGEITDEKADIYSVGVMLYEMLAGKLPFEADSAVSVAIMQLQSEAQPPRQINPNIPEGLEDITVKAMQKDPSKRYQSAAEMLYDIDEFKKNPSIHFEYKYFVDDSPTRYMETISRVKGSENESADTEHEEEETGKKPFPIIPVLCAVAAAFLVVAMVFVGIVLSDKLGGEKGSGTQIAVPNFVGKTLDEISQNPEYMEYFTFESQKEEYSDKAAGVVLDQSLDAGTMVKKAAKKSIVLTVSKGPKMMRIPDVVGRHRDDAEAALKNAGFVVKYTLDVSDEIQKDFVISLSPSEYPAELNYGSEITMVVSSGATPAEPVAMPEVKNLSKEQAIALLTDAGFVVNEADITYVNTAVAPANTVLSQSIPANTPTEVGTAVKLEISTGFVNTKVQIAMPETTQAVDVQIFVDGQLEETIAGILPSDKRVLTVEVAEAADAYPVTVKLARANTNKFEDYARYQVNGKTGVVQQEYLYLDILAKYTTTTTTTTTAAPTTTTTAAATTTTSAEATTTTTTEAAEATDPTEVTEITDAE